MVKEELHNISISDLFNSGKISVRTSTCCGNARFNSLFDIVSYYEQGNSFMKIRNAGCRTSKELEILCKEIIQQINNSQSEIELNETENKEKQAYIRKLEVKGLIENEFLFAIENKLITPDEIINYLSTNQKEFLTKRYKELIAFYSVRTKSGLMNINLEDFLKEFLFTDSKNLLKIRNFGVKSLKEGIDFKVNLKIEISKIINLSEVYFTIEEYIHKIGECIRHNFVFDYYSQNKHLPMFWILEQYFKNHNSKEIDIFINSFKIFQNQQIPTREEIAEKYNLSPERVRQIRNNVFRKVLEISDEFFEYKKNDDLFKYCQLLQNKVDWAYILDLLKEIKINQESFEIQECLKKEQCYLSFEFALHIIAYLFRDTFSLFGGFEISNRDRIWENTFLIKKEFTDIFDFEKFIEEFKNHIADNEIEYNLNIDDYLTNSACWTSVIDVNKFDNIVSIVKDILLHEFHLYSNFDGLITIPATKERNLLDVVYEILQQNGNPMHLDEIFIEFKKILPEHKYTEATQLRSWLQRHEAISSRNRRSVYTLKEWEHIKSGTIRDAIVEFLVKNDLPQTADDITDYVLQYFPKTNIASVRTTMLNDTQKRFPFFGDSLFGLISKEYPSEYEETKQQEGQRKAFEQRLYDLEKFLSENDHFPFSTSDNEEETSLYRWWRIQNRDTKLSEQQKADIERIKTQYADFDTDKTIYEWFCHSNNFKLFVLENRRLPSARGDEKFLYGWLRRAKDDFSKQRLNEKQRRKYVELFKEIDYAER